MSSEVSILTGLSLQRDPNDITVESGKLAVPQMMLAGASAEILGTIALLPFESARCV